jgi:hypothetical protein
MDQAQRARDKAYNTMMAIPHVSTDHPTMELETAADNLDIAEAELEFASSYYEVAKRHFDAFQ